MAQTRAAAAPAPCLPKSAAPRWCPAAEQKTPWPPAAPPAGRRTVPSKTRWGSTQHGGSPSSSRRRSAVGALAVAPMAGKYGNPGLINANGACGAVFGGCCSSVFRRFAGQNRSAHDGPRYGACCAPNERREGTSAAKDICLRYAAVDGTGAAALTEALAPNNALTRLSLSGKIPLAPREPCLWLVRWRPIRRWPCLS